MVIHAVAQGLVEALLRQLRQPLALLHLASVLLAVRAYQVLRPFGVRNDVELLDLLAHVDQVDVFHGPREDAGG
jgi:hypothetical protein